jgi:hypothetical protein
MELKSNVDYYSHFCTLKIGKTTIGKGLTEEEKQRMLKDFPDWFEVIKGTETQPEIPVEKELVVETPEDGLVIETPEVKIGKSRKK